MSEMKSVFDGWTKQAIGVASDSAGRKCAWECVLDAEVLVRIGRYIDEPNFAMQIIINANDRKKWNPAKFREIDLLSQGPWKRSTPPPIPILGPLQHCRRMNYA